MTESQKGTSRLPDLGLLCRARRRQFSAFTRRLFTVHSRGLADLLMRSKEGSGKWAPGVQQEVSQTGALFVPSLAASSAKYDLLAFDRGPHGERDLYLGDPSREMNTPASRPVKRNPFPVRKVD